MLTMEVGRGKVRDWVASIAACMRASQAESGMSPKAKERREARTEAGRAAVGKELKSEQEGKAEREIASGSEGGGEDSVPTGEKDHHEQGEAGGPGGATAAQEVGGGGGQLRG
jgi:hypothetical protein